MKSIKRRFDWRKEHPLRLPDEFRGGPFIELRGRREVAVQGCQRILLCEAEHIRLVLREGILSVRGRGMHCMTYFAGAISIRGVIDAVAFEEEEEC